MTRSTTLSFSRPRQGQADVRPRIPRLRIRWTGIAALALGLAACQVPGTALKNGPETAPDAATTPSAPVDAPMALSSASLIGMSRERIAEVFGEPRQVRRESPAEVWQYSSANCVIDIYLYHVTGGGLSVSFVEARDAAAMAMEPDPCFQTLTQRAAL
jgi:hypothetical protein